jgi:hypothetical protein
VTFQDGWLITNPSMKWKSGGKQVCFTDVYGANMLQGLKECSC